MACIYSVAKYARVDVGAVMDRRGCGLRGQPGAGRGGRKRGTGARGPRCNTLALPGCASPRAGERNRRTLELSTRGTTQRAALRPTPAKWRILTRENTPPACRQSRTGRLPARDYCAFGCAALHRRCTGAARKEWAEAGRAAFFVAPCGKPRRDRHPKWAGHSAMRPRPPSPPRGSPNRNTGQ